ncbi:contactin-2 isoform X4 [Drosophila sulfurigaster albostrigata]|uniref:contactin-2 isoform X4 n=1 Tax=Drosophila sulfurigaster albostrigata TaxID=89887 RepID=UPI002D21D569|nr:contactin-2 isoform X4 [Drosophila sulfurigaster albostrigata]
MSSTSSSVLTLSSFNLLFFTQVLTVLSITIKYNEYATDKGGNFSIPCIAQGNIMWVKEHGNNNTIIQTGRVLVLRNVSTSDSGIYVCFATLPVTTRRTTTTATTTSATVTTAIAATSRTITTATATATTTTTQAATIPATAATTSPQQQQQQQENEEKQEEHKQNVKIADDDEKGHDNEQVKQVEQVEEEEEELEYQAFQRIRLTVRTTPGPVTQLYFKASTILGFLIWRFNKTQSGGYPVRSFTAEYRNVSYRVPPANVSYEHEWSRMDPINIAPNVRQMEVYRLAPNTTYEFRIWANNELGSGEVVTTNVTTLPETKEEVNLTELRARRRSRAPLSLATTDERTMMMMMTMRITRRNRSRLWRNSSAKYRYSLQVPPLNEFESTKCNFMALLSTSQIHLGC